ncbi:hypothetical protein GE09DRAFT_1193951 [Coniochaeta sp. 2T2.1]|nr:hypothetical protein GE09DRAFT_1193951 [Coniochaeta sp. 2T2.1]
MTSRLCTLDLWHSNETILRRLSLTNCEELNLPHSLLSPPAPGHSVAEFLDTVVAAGNHRYEFTREGRGCAGWVRDKPNSNLRHPSIRASPARPQPAPHNPHLHNTHLAILANESRLLILPTPSLVPTTTVLTPVTIFDDLSANAIRLIGSLNKQLVFLRKGSRIATVDEKPAREGRTRIHFFPADWMTSVHHLDVMVEVTPRGDVLLVKRDEVAVVTR